jgi:hypothetical protein
MAYILGDEDYFIIYDQAAYLKAKGSPSKLIAAKIYTGPYVVTDVSDQIMHEVRNPIYWDGTPKLSEVTVKFITDAESRILAVEHGEADLALYPPTTAAKTLTGRSDAYFVTGTPRSSACSGRTCRGQGRSGPPPRCPRSCAAHRRGFRRNGDRDGRGMRSLPDLHQGRRADQRLRPGHSDRPARRHGLPGPPSPAGRPDCHH